VPREPAAWLATIARNECRVRVRTRMREPLPAEEIETASAASDPLNEAIRRADLAALWTAIQALPPQQRDALVLRELGGLSYDELAAALTVSGAAVESLLFRARRRLRRTLRAAAASLTGLSWLESLAGGSAPVAVKVAVLGVGAAAVTGGVVGPVALDDRHPPRPPTHVRAHPATVVRDPVRHAVRVTAATSEASVAPVVLRERRAPVAAPRHEARSEGRTDDRRETRRPVVHENDGRGSSDEGSASVQGSSGTSGSGSSGRDGSAEERAPVTVAPVPAAPAVTSASGQDEHASGGGMSGDGMSGGGMSSDGGSSDGAFSLDGSDNGGGSEGSG
jgi:Sigma-70, region 4